MTDRIPVFVRVGDYMENLVGSIAIEPVPDSPDQVRIVGGALSMADLFEAAAVEIRRKAAEGQ